MSGSLYTRYGSISDVDVKSLHEGQIIYIGDNVYAYDEGKLLSFNDLQSEISKTQKTIEEIEQEVNQQTRDMMSYRWSSNFAGQCKNYEISDEDYSNGVRRYYGADSVVHLRPNSYSYSNMGDHTLMEEEHKQLRKEAKDRWQVLINEDDVCPQGVAKEPKTSILDKLKEIWLPISSKITEWTKPESIEQKKEEVKDKTIGISAKIKNIAENIVKWFTYDDEKLEGDYEK